TQFHSFEARKPVKPRKDTSSTATAAVAAGSSAFDEMKEAVDLDAYLRTYRPTKRVIDWNKTRTKSAVASAAASVTASATAGTTVDAFPPPPPSVKRKEKQPVASPQPAESADEAAERIRSETTIVEITKLSEL